MTKFSDVQENCHYWGSFLSCFAPGFLSLVSLYQNNLLSSKLTGEWRTFYK